MSRAPSETSLCDALYKPSLLAHLLTNLTRLRFAERGTVADPTQGYFRRPSVSRSLTAAGLSVLILFFAAISSTFCNADRNAFAEEGVKHSAVRPADLLTFQDASGQTQPVKTAADWEQRRQQILNRMQLAMGKLPDLKQRPAVTYRVLAREETPDPYFSCD